MSTQPAQETISVRNVPLPASEDLPDDPETLKAMIRELLTMLHDERKDRAALEHRLSLLLRRLYGPRSERFDPNQPLLFPDAAAAPDDPAPAATVDATAADPGTSDTGKRKARPHGRKLIPDHLRREPIDHELSAAERVCGCGRTRIDIGVEQTEILERRPAEYYVIQHRVHKYLCPHCAGQTRVPDDAVATPSTSTDITMSPADAAAAPVAPAAGASPEIPVDSTATTTTPAAAATDESATTPAAPAAPIAVVGPAIIAAKRPLLPFAKFMAGPGLMAHFVVSKFTDHLPLYRQERVSEREGLLIPRSTSCDWMAACADLLRPLYERMVDWVLQSAWLHTDDTTVKNIRHQAHEPATARFWIYWGDRDHPYNVFDFTLNHKRDGPKTFLAQYRGYLQADAFSGYDGLYLPDRNGKEPAIIEVACNAHARRKFYEARDSDLVRAHRALAYYGQLYELERRAKENAFDDRQRLDMRRQLAVPILSDFHAWLQTANEEVLPKSPLAGAIGYALNHWPALIRYTTAGFLEIDNNTAEREMKRIAIGRKNWLHVGSDEGGRTAAVLFSFTSTCQRLQVEPWAYLKDVFTRLPTTPRDDLDRLLPDRWQAARVAAAKPIAPTPAETT